jgi:dihydrofolate reductase
MFMSIDGYTEAPGGEFVGPEWSSDLDRWTEDLMESADTLLFGRIGWQELQAYWPNAEADPGTPAEAKLARYMNRTRKIVFSRSLTNVDGWSHSELATGNVIDTVDSLRMESGGGIAILAGAKFARTCLSAGVVDELRLLVIPQLFGGGSRLFDGAYAAERFTLLEARPMDTGAVLLRYERRQTE